MPTSSQNLDTSLRARVPEKNTQLVAMTERADRLMEKRRTSRIPVSLADLEDLKNLVHEAAELGHKARFLWLSADERADNLGRQLFDARAELAQMRAERDALQSRLNRVMDICDEAERAGITSGGPFTVSRVHAAALGDDVRKGGAS